MTTQPAEMCAPALRPSVGLSPAAPRHNTGPNEPLPDGVSRERHAAGACTRPPEYLPAEYLLPAAVAYWTPVAWSSDLSLLDRPVHQLLSKTRHQRIASYASFNNKRST